MSEPQTRLERLLGFLEADPGNLSLIGEAAGAALEAGLTEEARGLLERHEALAPLPPALRNLRGMLALRQGRWEEAAADFEALLEESPGDPPLRFNLAWARALGRQFDAVAGLIDERVVDASPRAAALKVEALHHLGQLEEALEVGQALAERRPDDPLLMGALANAALDAEELDLAKACARKAGDAPGGAVTLGVLELADDRVDEAMGLFDRALQLRPNDARALLGKGMALMSQGRNDAAVVLIDEAAGLFQTHLGSWVASGWAHFALADYGGARRAFETAMELDDTFAETHGGLAVLDILSGDLESGRQRTDVALRLDRECLSAALAKSLLLRAQGDERTAERVLRIAMSLPVGPNGKTITEAMAGMGLAAGPRGPRQ